MRYSPVPCRLGLLVNSRFLIYVMSSFLYTDFHQNGHDLGHGNNYGNTKITYISNYVRKCDVFDKETVMEFVIGVSSEHS